MKADYEETHQTWNKIADLYESKFMHLNLYDDTYRFFGNLLTSEIPEILEIGCGPGNISKFMLREFPSVKMTGIDTSTNMIALAKTHNPQGDFRVMDARNIAEFNVKFDGIICGFCIPYLDVNDCQELVKNAANLLMTNGVFYVSFVAGDEELSGYQTGSGGDRVYFYYYPVVKIENMLTLSGLGMIKKFEIPYKKSDGSAEIHTVLMAKKI
jgi:SAM-dependent methyltransferase